ncbi:MAG: response regulator [Vulcanimicrobiota bacterium]
MSHDPELLQLFQDEVRFHLGVLTEGLLALEKSGLTDESLEPMLRATHSIKAGARLMEIQAIAELAHALEEVLMRGPGRLTALASHHIDTMLEGLDAIKALALADQPVESGPLVDRLRALATMEVAETPAVASTGASAGLVPGPRKAVGDRSLRVSAERLDALIGLSSEVHVSRGWLTGFRSTMLTLKRQMAQLTSATHELGARLEGAEPLLATALESVDRLVRVCNGLTSHGIHDLENYDRRMFDLSSRLRQEVMGSRMCPFSEGVSDFSRMLRDVARNLGKQVDFTIEGLETPVDRDILERIEAPLNHMLVNSVDHGIESPQDRQRVGKPGSGRLVLRAAHRAGRLVIEIEDDGRGLDLDQLRPRLVDQGLVAAEAAERLSDEDLLEFLFVPKFTTRQQADQYSGRGVGLDVVRSVVDELGGRVRLSTTPGQGMRTHLFLPLTLSVTRCLIVEVAGEPFALPLSRIERLFRLERRDLVELQGLPHVPWSGGMLPLAMASQLLGWGSSVLGSELEVLVLGHIPRRVGLVVDRLVGQQELVLQPLDRLLDSFPCVTAGAILDDGNPVLILNVEELVARLDEFQCGPVRDWPVSTHKRVMVVDDSLLSRQTERKLLEAEGYEVEVACDGIEGWTALCSGVFDLLVCDVQMPRLGGLELVTKVRREPTLAGLSILLVSSREEGQDRLLGLDVGADYFLAKEDFDRGAFIRAVHDLIGGPET